MRPVLVFLSCSIMLFMAAPAQAEPIGLDAVIRHVLVNHPDISLSRLQLRITRTDQQSIEGQLDPQVTASLLSTNDQNPTNSLFNPVISNTFQQIRGDITKPLSNGDTVTIAVDYNRSLQTFESANQFALFDPSYHNQIDLTWRHALLRGSGRPAYHQALAAALADESAARFQEAVTARNLSRQAIQLYFDIDADAVNRRLAFDTAKRAGRLLAYQKNRERFGLIEKADRLQTEALLAKRSMELADAEARLAEDTTALNRLMLRDPDTLITTRDDQGLDDPLPDLGDTMDVADKRRPELLALAARIKAAEARLAEAGDDDRAQLDLVGQIGSRALAGTYGTAARKGFSLANRFASIGIEFKDTVINNTVRAAIRKAALQREQVLAEHRQTRELIKDDLARLLSLIRSGRKTWAAARIRELKERKKFDAELARYREGRSDTATVIQFEGDLRAGEIETALRRIALLRNQRQLAWAEGTLLDTLGIEFPFQTQAEKD